MGPLLKDKVAVVTGGAGLLGRDLVRAIASEGGVAVIADMNEKPAAALIKEIENSGRHERADFVKMDITSAPSLRGAIEYLDSRYGRIDALVNCAYPRNKNYGRKFEEVTFADFSENLNLHLGGYFLASQQFGLYFRKQGYGNIINMASIYGVMAPRFEVYEGTAMTMPVEYAVIKSALIHLTKYMAKYFKGSGIRVNAVSPGGVFDGQPEDFVKRYNGFCLTQGLLRGGDVNGALLFLLSGMSEYMNGQNLVVDDGYSL